MLVKIIKKGVCFMVAFYILLALAIVLSTAFIIAWSRDRALLSFFLKGLASVSVVSLGIYTVSMSMLDTTTILLLVGLLFCLFGDLALALPELCGTNMRANIYTSGTVAFSLAQIAFIVMLAFIDINTLFGLIFGAVFAGCIFLLKKPMKLDFGKCLTPSLIYAVLLGANVAGSIILMFTANFSLISILLALGFIFFVASDLVLSQIYYGGNTKPITQKINYILYYIAIILLASSFVAI